MNCAAVIVNYNDSVRICNLVNKLLTFNIFKYIVISDNNSIKSEKEILEQIKDKRVQIIFNESNYWFSGGNNIALNFLKDKTIDYVFTINSDVDFEFNLIKSSIDFLEKNKDFAIVSAKMLENGEFKQCYYNFPTIGGVIAENLLLKKIFRIKPKVRERKKDYYVVDYIRSSYWCVNFKDFSKIDFFDTNARLYHVETCVGLKLKQLGKKNAILTTESYFHNHIYKDGYKMKGYIDSHNSLKYIFKKYYKKNKFSIFLMDISYHIGYIIRKIFRVK